MDDSFKLDISGIKTPAIYQGDFMLDKYCQLRAQHCKKREAYRKAFGVPPDMPGSTLDSQIKSLYDHHPEIERRIAECAAELHEEWMHRIYEGLERLWQIFLIYIGDPKTAGLALMAFRVIVTVTGVGQAFGVAQSGTTTSTAIDTSQVERKLDALIAKLGIKEGGNP